MNEHNTHIHPPDYCPLLTLLDNGMITYDPAFGNINGNFPEETTANFECDADYTLVGSERICTASDGSGMGSWSGVDAVCQRKFASNLCLYLIVMMM